MKILIMENGMINKKITEVTIAMVFIEYLIIRELSQIGKIWLVDSSININLCQAIAIQDIAIKKIKLPPIKAVIFWRRKI